MRKISRSILLVLATTASCRQTVLDEKKSAGKSRLLNILPPYVGENLGQYSPYFPAAEYLVGPEDCTLSLVNLLYRHGARYPTASATLKIETTVNKLKSASHYTDPRLDFMKTFVYDYGVAALLPYGAEEAVKAGQEAYARYGDIVPEDFLRSPFVRAAGSTRVIDTANNWTASFIRSSSGTVDIAAPLIISEENGSNNTLNNNNCPALNRSISDIAQFTYLSSFAPPITARLNVGAPGANLDDSDTINVFFLCGFDTVAKETTSPFCELFSPEEFVAFEYYQDLGKYYDGGHGNPLGPVQGAGYVNELLARLTSKPVKPRTNINRTLDGDTSSFPLDRTLYVDFSHDNQMTSIYSALGLHKPRSGDLSITHRTKQDDWVLSKMVPFAGRLAVELFTCKDIAAKESGSQWVRILNDDAVLDQPGCRDIRPDGLCELRAFIESQRFSTEDEVEELWAKCQAP